MQVGNGSKFAAAAPLSAIAIAIAAPPSAHAVAPASFVAADANAASVVFTTRERMVPQDIDSAVDVYARTQNITRLLSIGTSGGNGNFNAGVSTIGPKPANIGIGTSASLSRVVFTTSERLLPVDTDSRRDVYYYENGSLAAPTSNGYLTSGNGDVDVNLKAVHADGSIAFERPRALTSSIPTAPFATSTRPTPGSSWSRDAVAATRARRTAPSTPVTPTRTSSTSRRTPASNSRLPIPTTPRTSTGATWMGCLDPNQPGWFLASDSDTANDNVAATSRGIAGNLFVWQTTEQAIDASDDDTDVDAYSRRARGDDHA